MCVLNIMVQVHVRGLCVAYSCCISVLHVVLRVVRVGYEYHVIVNRSVYSSTNVTAGSPYLPRLLPPILHPLHRTLTVSSPCPHRAPFSSYLSPHDASTSLIVYFLLLQRIPDGPAEQLAEYVDPVHPHYGKS